MACTFVDVVIFYRIPSVILCTITSKKKKKAVIILEECN